MRSRVHPPAARRERWPARAPDQVADKGALGDAATFCVCASNYYETINNGGDMSCALCLEHEMDCRPDRVGLTILDVPIKAGFWRSSNVSNNILACPVKEACPGNSSCLEGHEGPF